jgi:hypothetical protein
MSLKIKLNPQNMILHKPPQLIDSIKMIILIYFFHLH